MAKSKNVICMQISQKLEPSTLKKFSCFFLALPLLSSSIKLWSSKLRLWRCTGPSNAFDSLKENIRSNSSAYVQKVNKVVAFFIWLPHSMLFLPFCHHLTPGSILLIVLCWPPTSLVLEESALSKSNGEGKQLLKAGNSAIHHVAYSLSRGRIKSVILKAPWAF